MTHIPVEDMFRLADGDLSAEEKKAFIRHISACDQCKQQIRQIVSFNDELMDSWNEYQSRKCPNEEILFQYMEGKMAGEEILRIEGLKVEILTFDEN